MNCIRMYVVELRPLDASAVEAPGEVASDEFGEYDRIDGPTAVRCVGGHRWIDQRRSIAQPSPSGRPQNRRRSGRAAEALVVREVIAHAALPVALLRESLAEVGFEVHVEFGQRERTRRNRRSR